MLLGGKTEGTSRVGSSALLSELQRPVVREDEAGRSRVQGLAKTLGQPNSVRRILTLYSNAGPNEEGASFLRVAVLTTELGRGVEKPLHDLFDRLRHMLDYRHEAGACPRALPAALGVTLEGGELNVTRVCNPCERRSRLERSLISQPLEAQRSCTKGNADLEPESGVA